MNYTDTKTLYPNDEKSVGFDKESLEQLKNINERLDNMSNDIADLNNEVDGLDNQVVTENLQAAQASLQEASVNELNAQSASVSELEAGNATANKVTSRGEIKGANLEISGTSHLKDDVTVDGKVISASVRAGSVTTDHLIADEIDVTDFTVDELSVTEKATIKEEEVETSVVTTQTVSSQTVESQEVTSQNVINQDVTSQEVTNQEVENAVIEDAEIKALTSGGNTFNFNSGNSIAITEDSYIRIKPEINSEIRLIFKTALNATILAAAISVDVPAADKANVHLVYSNTEALSDIYFDANGNLWLKLETGVRGTLYFMQSGINAIIPETPEFDPTAEGTIHYAAGNHGDIFITAKVIFNSEVQVDKNANFKKNVEVDGNMHVEGNLDVDGRITVGGFVSERAQYLGNSDYVTADDEGNFEAKDGAFDGDVTATGEISSTGDMTAGGDVNAVGDVSGTNIHATNDLDVDGAASVGESLDVAGNITTQGKVTAEDGFEGDLTGDVTGDVTGNADTADKWKTSRKFKIADKDNVNHGSETDVDGDGDVTLYLPDTIKADLDGTASKAENDSNGNEISTTYAEKKEVVARGYSSVVYASQLTSQQIISALENGSYSKDGKTYNIGSNPLFVGQFTINQDITLYSGIDSINGLGCNILYPETLYPNSEYTKLDFGNHKLTIPSSGIQFTNVHLKNTVMSVSGWGVLYVRTYCARLENISTYIAVSEEIYFQLKNSRFEDSTPSYTDGPRYFRDCKDSTVILTNKDDNVSQKTALFNCEGCTFNLKLDKNLGSNQNTNTAPVCPCIIDGLFNCTINYEARYLYTKRTFQCGIRGDEQFIFYSKAKTYYAKNCSFFIDYRYISTSAVSGADITNFEREQIFGIIAFDTIASGSTLGTPESIADCFIKVVADTTNGPYKPLIDGIYIASYNSGNGIVNFNRNKVIMKGNFYYDYGSLFGVSTKYGIKDNSFILDDYMSFKYFYTLSAIYGFTDNDFYHKRQSGENAYDPWSDGMMQGIKPKIYCILPPSQDISANGTAPSGYTTVFESTAKNTFWMGNNSFNSY